MVMMLWVTGGGGGGDGGREGAAAAAEGGGDLERSPHHLHTSCLQRKQEQLPPRLTWGTDVLHYRL